MAEVYVAKAKGIGGFEKLVAIKVIHPRFSEDDHFVQMLVEEAKISVQLSHVNIAQTFDLGCIDDTYYIAMEYIEGADAYRVTHRAKDRKLALPIDICIYIASEICNGLGYAHRKRDPEGRSMGIVHRDISPQNVLMSFAGEVKLVDFGIAKAALRGGQTEVGVIKGKYYYMSPEQAWGDPVDARSDLFSAGIVLHELLCGDMVYQENNVPALLDKVRKAEIDSPRARRPDVTPQLEAVLMKALAKDPEDRYPSAHAFGQALTEQLYKGNPTFTASRLSQLMATLFPEDVKRHSQVLKLPEAMEPAEPSSEQELPSMSKDEFMPSREASVVFDLGDAEDDDETRNDILPFRKGDRSTKQIDPPPSTGDGPTSPDRFAGFGVAAPEEWEEETHLKERGDWDESTLVDEDGDAFMNAHGAIRAMRDGEPEELSGESTVATPNPLAYLATRVAEASEVSRPGGVHDRTSTGAPAFEDDDDDEDEPQRTAVAATAFPDSDPPDKTAIGATAFPDSDPPPPPQPARAAFPRPSGVKPKSVPPPPGRLPPRRIPPPAQIPQPPRPLPPEEDSVTLDELAPRTSAPPEGSPRHLAPGAPEELPAEPTMALPEGGSGPHRRAAPLSATSQGGIRLGPEADRFFAPPTGEADALPAPGQQPFDPFGGVPVKGTGAGQRPLDDPFTRPPPEDPFAAAPRAEELPEDPSAQLGKPRPIRWILAFVAVAVLVAGVAALGAWIASRPDPTSLTLITTPEGATVRLDGRELPHRTPVTLPDQEAGHEVELVLSHPGHEERTDSFPLREGENRRVYHLNPIRVSLRIATEPAGAQVWVDGVLRGSAPLEISGLSEGDELALRANLLGRQVEQSYTVGGDREQAVSMTLPAPDEDEE